MNARSMRRIPLPVVAVVAVVIGACTIGEWDEAVMNSPRGLQAEFRIGDEEFSGELLTADTMGILVLLGDGPATAAWSDIERFGFPELRSVRVDGGEPPPARHLERIRLAARYPWALTDAQLREVGERSGWAEVREIGR